MFLAALLALGGYSLLLALRRDPVAGIAGQPLTVPQSLPEPDRLSRRREAEPAAASGPGIALPGRQVPLQITVTGVTTLPAGAGVAICARDTRSPLAWLPLSSAERRGDRVVAIATVPLQPVRCYFAPEAASATTAYWCAVDGPETAVEAAVTIDGAVHEVDLAIELTGPALPDPLPFAVRRRDAPEWRPRASGPAGLLLPRDRRLRLQLANGDYEFEPLVGGPWRPESVAVTGPTARTVSFQRSARADRP